MGESPAPRVGASSGGKTAERWASSRSGTIRGWRRRFHDGDGLRFGAAPQLSGQFQELLSLPPARDPDAGQDAVPQGAEQRFVAATRHNGWRYGWPIGRAFGKKGGWPPEH
jgi:CubicO group peptidase (beta-lactamase class C family)